MKMTWITGLCGVALAGLTACGPLYQSHPNAVAFQGVVTGLTGFGADAAADSSLVDDSSASAPEQTLTRAFIDAQELDLLRISVISREATGIVFFAGSNGNKVTWISLEGVSFVFENGLLIGTRGFGDDLMGSDADAGQRSLAGGGNHIRTLDFLNGLSQIERRTYQCATVQTGREDITIVERTYTTSVFEETCTGSTGDFKNTYWRDANGVIWQSRQWISDGVGYLGYQRL